VADRKPDQADGGLRWNGHRIPLISWIASWPTKSGDRITIGDLIVIGVIVAVVGTAAVAFALGSGSSGGTAGEETNGKAVTKPEGTEDSPGATTTGGSKPGAHTVVEYADNREGSPVYADPTGAPVEGVPSRIPFGTKVLVSCFAPNESGMSSVSGFYRIASGEWQGSYVVADTMTNGGEVGETETPNVDSRVRGCSAEEE
jgi:hypothetical protein